VTPAGRHRGAARRARRARRAAAAAALAATAVGLSGCQLTGFGMPDAATTQGQEIYRLWQGAVVTALAVGGVVLVLILFVIVRYRRRDDDTVPSQREYNYPLEATYTVIPLLIVIGLFYFTAKAQERVEKVSSTPAVRVEVTGFQWGWQFQYQGTGVSVTSQGDDRPVLVLPVDRTTRITLVSVDVVHAFFVPGFLFKRDAVPGITNRFDLHPVATGTFRGHCAEFCGLRHADMLFDVSVVPTAQFDTWLTGQGGSVAQ
jgi:cytochrome c oxidase subunit II